MPHSSLSLSRAPISVAFRSATISTTAQGMGDIGFTEEELDNATRAVISAHGTEMHFRYDGGSPTASVGIHLGNSTGRTVAIVCGNENIRNLEFIKEQGGTDGPVSIQLEAM